jgi:isoleucyl-tRNA synthetase
MKERPRAPAAEGGKVPFGPVDSQLDLVGLEHRVQARWQAQDVLGQVVKGRAGAPRWVFYEGPPTANARPGLHHVWPRAFKDLFIRYQTMRGHDVPRKGGWDCHGLPVELEVEKELGISNKHEIEAYGIAAFNERCRASVRRYVSDFEALTERAAVWIDTKDAYWTLDNTYIESVWWLLGQLWDNDLLYEGFRVSPYCARCGTALSSHELGQPGAYRDVTDLSVYVRFPVDDRDFDLLVWTTTPWTLISNVAAAVGPDIDYVRVRSDSGRDLVMAAARAPEGADVVERMTGADLIGLRYHRPFDFLPIDDRGQRVVGADFVSTEEGSGIVHLAPAFGADDMEVAQKEGLPVLNPVGPDGAFSADVAPWQGSRRRDRRGLAQPRAARARGAVPSLLSALLAVRHATHLLGQDVVVRPHRRTPGRPAPRERAHRLAPRVHQARALRRLAREQHRLGPLPRPLLGYAAPDLALRRRPRQLRELGRRAERPGRARPQRPRPAPALRRRDRARVPDRRVQRGGPARDTRHRRVVRLGIDADSPAPLHG